jgi:large conductance mechanosensitive channel
MSVASEFKDFVLRGNVVDLAVGVVIGAGFGAVVTALVKDIITPLIGMPGKVDFKDIHLTLGHADFLVGDFLNTVISFLLLAFVVFFFVVKPVNLLMAMRKTEPASAPLTKECPRCLSSIPSAATRCAFCTSDVPAI